MARSEEGALVAVIADEDTITGFLLAGVGDVDLKKRANFLVVDNKTNVRAVEAAFKDFCLREDIAIILISQPIANMIRSSVANHSRVGARAACSAEGRYVQPSRVPSVLQPHAAIAHVACAIQQQVVDTYATCGMQSASWQQCSNQHEGSTSVCAWELIATSGAHWMHYACCRAVHTCSAGDSQQGFTLRPKPGLIANTGQAPAGGSMSGAAMQLVHSYAAPAPGACCHVLVARTIRRQPAQAWAKHLLGAASSRSSISSGCWSCRMRPAAYLPPSHLDVGKGSAFAVHSQQQQGGSMYSCSSNGGSTCSSSSSSSYGGSRHNQPGAPK